MKKYTLLLLLPFLLYAEMKCEAGKCGSGDTSMKKQIPEKMTAPKVVDKQNIHKRATVEQLFNVTTVKVKSLSTAKEQINYGYIVAADNAKVDVTAWFSGYVQTLYADTLYKKVERGDVLATVYSPEVYKAKQDYLNAVLFHGKRPAANMVQSAKVKLILLGVNKVEITQIKNEKKAGRFTNIYAPRDGWIFSKNIKQGSYVSNKKVLFEIVDLSKVWLEAKLFQDELAGLNHFEHFNVKVKGIEKTFKASKSLLYPMIDPKMATLTLRFTLDNKDELLKPGMYAKLHSSAMVETRLVIPRTAAMRKNGTWYAFLATEFKGVYEPIEIEVKPLDTKHFEVIKGLQEDDTLVNNALFMMDSDAQINAIY